VKLPQLAADKANHAIYGAGIYAIVVTAEMIFGVTMYEQAAFGAVCVMAVLKELVDRITANRQVEAGLVPTHTSDGLDALATVLGGLTLHLVRQL
jgi:hypothetical protein